MIFQPFFVDFQTVFTILHRKIHYYTRNIFLSEKKNPGLPGGFYLPHPGDRKQTFYLVLPTTRHTFLHTFKESHSCLVCLITVGFLGVSIDFDINLCKGNACYYNFQTKEAVRLK